MDNVVRLAPEIPPAMIAEEEVSSSRLASFLDAAVIEHEIDQDGDLYASDGLEFPVWIDVDAKRKLIHLLTVFKPDTPKNDLLCLVNGMNGNIVSVQFFLDSGQIWGQYWLTYEGGLNVRQFIKMLRRFAGAFKAGITMNKGD